MAPQKEVNTETPKKFTFLIAVLPHLNGRAGGAKEIEATEEQLRMPQKFLFCPLNQSP